MSANVIKKDSINYNGWNPPNIEMIQSRTLIISNNASTFEYNAKEILISKAKTIDFLQIEIIAPSGKTVFLDKASGENMTVNNDCYEDKNYVIYLKESGEYKIKFLLHWFDYTAILLNKATDEHHCKIKAAYIYVNPEESSVAPYTLAGTIERLLALTPIRTKDKPPKYVFDPIQLEEYRKEESPEFAFTGHTLFEALLQIAQYKGCFPQLKGNVISFRKLWNGKRLSEADLPPPIEEISSRDINQYCTYLETEVQNLVGINDSRAGSIIEPYDGGYKTVRSANGSEISQDTAVIPTDYNMYLHIKQEVGYIGDSIPEENDLTDYVYESGDYYTLTDKTAAYPASKAYALQWQQMGRNVTELAHRVNLPDDAIEIVKAFKQPAMANIIKAKTGINYDTGIVKYILDMIGIKEGNSFADLMFRTTYIPVINSRIKQYKDYYGDFHYDGSLKYNQTAELVDSEMYGQHLKELLRKLGNVTKRKTYIFDKIDDVPETGTVVDGFSVYDVNMSLRENKVIATISYVKYAELSRYIGVKNAWKDSDVSTDKCYNRQISYNEYLMFTHREGERGTSACVTKDLLAHLLPQNSAATATCVQATGYTADGAELNTVLLPVVSLAMGNSIMFQWQYQNNYSAGYMSEKAPDGATNVLSGTKYNRAQKAVKYADAYGKLETYDFSLKLTGPVPKDIIWTEGVFLNRANEVYWIYNEEDVGRVRFVEYQGEIGAQLYRSPYAPNTEPYRLRVFIKSGEISKFDIRVELAVNVNGKTEKHTVYIGAGKDAVTTNIIYNPSDVRSIEVTLKDTYSVNELQEGVHYTSDSADISQLIAHSLPLKHKGLISRDGRSWHGVDYFNLNDLVVKKNSSEALTFSVQLHYCTDNENFIIGNGLTNFCPLVGGSSEEIKLYVFKERINIFDRRISVANALFESEFSAEYNPNYKCIEITLPPEIDRGNSWVVAGKDKHNGHQIIFGENRRIDGDYNFDKKLFLLPLKEKKYVV